MGTRPRRPQGRRRARRCPRLQRLRLLASGERELARIFTIYPLANQHDLAKPRGWNRSEKEERRRRGTEQQQQQQRRESNINVARIRTRERWKVAWTEFERNTTRRLYVMYTPMSIVYTNNGTQPT